MIAKPGMGKTTLLFDFLQKVRNHAKTVFLFQPQAVPEICSAVFCPTLASKMKAPISFECTES